jgi:hypothetical protein
VRIRELLLQPWTSYESAKKDSEEIDRLLGFRLEEVEEEIRSSTGDRQDWSNLSAQAFQTPYQELADIVRRFQEERELAWLDLGAAYGRLGLILSILRPQDRFLGLEFVLERVRHGTEVLKPLCPKAELRLVDVTAADFDLPPFDVLFLFDFGTPAQISSLLDRIQERALRSPVTVVGRGRATRHLIETAHPWLSQVERPLHTAHWSLYRSSEKSAGSCLAEDKPSF